MPLKYLFSFLFASNRFALVLLFILFAGLPVKSQNASLPSLSKYTYFLVMHKKDGTGFGTGSGFFYRKNKKLYLITCYHLFTGLDFWSGEQRGPYDSIWVRYFDNRGAERFVTIKTVGKTFELINFHNNPDIYTYEIDPSLFINAKIYSIENFVRPKEYSAIVLERQKLFSFQYAGNPGGFLVKLKEKVSNHFNNQLVTSINLQSFLLPATEHLKIAGIGEAPVAQPLSSLIAISIDSAKLLTRSTLQFPPSTANPNFQPTISRLSLTPITLSQLIAPDSIVAFKNSGNNEILKVIGTKVNSNGKLEFTTSPLRSNQLQLVTINNQPFVSNQNSQGILSKENTLQGPTFLFGDKTSSISPITDLAQSSSDQSPFRFESNANGTFIVKYGDSSYSPVQLFGMSANKSNSIINLPKSDFPVLSNIPLQTTALKPKAVRDLSDFMKFSELEPWYYEASVVPATSLGIQWDFLRAKYFLTSPSSYHGGSGSPIFIKCTGIKNGKKVEWIQFAGMQCANMTESYPNSFLIAKEFTAILKEEEILSKLQGL